LDAPGSSCFDRQFFPSWTLDSYEVEGVQLKLVMSAFLFFLLGQLVSSPALADPIKDTPRYGHSLCDHPDFHCLTIAAKTALEEGETRKRRSRKGRPVAPSWEELWPEARERDIVQRINRMCISLRPGMVIAVPNDMRDKTFMDFSPLPLRVDYEGNSLEGPEDRLEALRAKGYDYNPELRWQCHPAPEREAWPDPEAQCQAPELTMSERLALLQNQKNPDRKLLIYDPKLLAFGAYDNDGRLLRWGPGVGGASYCADIGRSCRTKTGVTFIRHKRGRYARSNRYPLPNGGAPVPYFMEFWPQYGFHASANVPGRHASHGCVRLFFEDARWLNEEFAEIGTKVIVRPY
jgi:hypothetical protein